MPRLRVPSRTPPKRGSGLFFRHELTIQHAGVDGGARPSRALRAQTLLDRNKALIHEINKNHEARAAGGMERNVDLLRELNSNVAKAQELYEEAGAGLSFATGGGGGVGEAERRA